jgi:hypothetical protein
VKVFAVFLEPLAGVVKLWAQSWETRGWVPQLISAQETEEHGSVRAAARARGGGLLTDLRVLNFSYSAKRTPKRRVVRVGRSGWLTAPLVRFSSEVTEQEILDCGRPL